MGCDRQGGDGRQREGGVAIGPALSRRPHFPGLDIPRCARSPCHGSSPGSALRSLHSHQVLRLVHYSGCSTACLLLSFHLSIVHGVPRTHGPFGRLAFLEGGEGGRNAKCASDISKPKPNTMALSCGPHVELGERLMPQEFGNPALTLPSPVPAGNLLSSLTYRVHVVGHRVASQLRAGLHVMHGFHEQPGALSSTVPACQTRPLPTRHRPGLPVPSAPRGRACSEMVPGPTWRHLKSRT